MRQGFFQAPGESEFRFDSTSSCCGSKRLVRCVLVDDVSPKPALPPRHPTCPEKQRPAWMRWYNIGSGQRHARFDSVKHMQVAAPARSD